MSNDENEILFAGAEVENAPEFIDRYLDLAGKPRPDLWRIGVDELNAVSSAPALAWQQIGPNPLNNLPLPADSQRYQGLPPVGGEVTDVAIDPFGPTDATMYAATNNGGIWKSTDGGATWAPISDGMPSLSMGAVAIDAGNRSILYAGSGNLFDGQRGLVKSSGLYKSVDEGRTWFVADGGVFGTSFAGIGINRIVSTAADSLLVGTDKGLFRSIDGARNFGANAPKFDDGKPIINGFVSALVMDTAAANKAWVAIRGLDDDLNPFPGGGLFQLALNLDGSVTPSANLLNNLGGLAGLRFGLIVFAQSTQFPAGTANNNILYAAVQDSPKPPGPKPFFVGLYRSTNSGVNWTLLGNLKTMLAAANEDNQSNYDFTLGVDPQNADLVYAGFKQVWRSTNGTTGATFAPCSISPATQNMVHWDQHELVFSPSTHWVAGSPTTIYVGSDGGVARSTDGGTTWNQLNTGMGTHLFLGIDIGRGNAARNQVTFGGSQDNGTAGHRATDVGTAWLAGIDGDGGVVAVDPADATIIYGFDNSLAIKTTQQGQSWAMSSDNGSVAISGASATSPIVITANGHLFQDGDQVTITGVGGVNAANSPPLPGGGLQKWTVTVKDANNFSLNGSSAPAGSPPYVAGSGFAIGRRFGRNLQNPDNFNRRVALVPNGNVAATTVYVAEAQDLRKSTDGGANFAKDVLRHFDHFVFAMVCPDANRIWVATGDGQVHLSSDAGASWKNFSPGPTTPATGVAVDPRDVTRVAVAYAGFAGLDQAVPTQHCFLSTNEGADWKDISGTDGSPQTNLPDLPLHSVAFDGSTNPSTIVVASDAAVLQSADNGATWQLLGAGLPRTTCRSLAIDNTFDRSPLLPARLLRLGTYGRSSFELVRLTGPRLVVTANLAFGAMLQGKSRSISIQVFNVGDTAITFNNPNFTPAGNPDFALNPAPDLSPLPPGGVRTFSVLFTAGGNGIRSATFTLQTNDAVTPSIQIPASGLTFASGKPRLAVKGSFQFGEVQRGASRTIHFLLTNAGLADLLLSNLSLTGNGEFKLSAAAPPQITLAAGEEKPFDLTYSPNTWGGSSKTSLRLVSNDPRQPTLEIPANGSAPVNIGLIIGLALLGAAAIVGGISLGEYLKSKKH